jgi:CheY-like chemotaxis protein
LLSDVKVLVVDDDDDARDLLETVLGHRQARVFSASSAADAFELVRRERPDMLISDIAMPEEDGYSLIRRVRALASLDGGTTPAIAVTAYAGRSDRDRAIAAGFDAHLAKPVDIDALVATILDILRAQLGR